MTRTWRKIGVAFVLCLAATCAAQTFTDLVDLNGIDGYEPLISLAQGPDGNLYGTTFAGGQYYTCAPGCGTIFKVSPEGTLTSLYSFCADPTCPHGDQPYAGLLLSINGSFYGSTVGGWGVNDDTLFKITPEGLTTFHVFGGPDGYAPNAALIQADDANLYGTTINGGNSRLCSYGCGTVFRITASGTLTTLHIFNGSDGALPYAALVQANDGNFYGTTTEGGAQNFGTVFKIDRKGTFTTLYSFCTQASCADGSNPMGGLVQGNDGNFYGTTADGGDLSCNPPNGCGTIFKMTAAGALTTLHTFAGADGANPFAALIQATDGSLYGTTYLGGGSRSGTIFTINLSGKLTTLHSFNGLDGYDVYGGLVQSTNGTLYGTTADGGAYGFGNVFSLDMGLGPFVAFVHSSGHVAQTGGILGQGFTGTTSVSLNGTPASFKVKSDTFIEATVPPGATTGYVTVSTPTGTLTSNVPFRVIP